MTKKLRPYLPLFIVIGAGVILALARPSLARPLATNTGSAVLEVTEIVPLVMVLMALFDVWVPSRLVEDQIGPASGARGMALAILLGTAAAGPLYAAFPVAVSLQKKGARLANIVIFLGTWASIKIPMILLESSFIGLRFSLLRLALTVPGVIAMGVVMERALPANALLQPAGAQSGQKIAAGPEVRT